MKHRSFSWSWNDYAAQPDKLMTRSRASALLRSWRRSVRTQANYNAFVSVSRIGAHAYKVVHDCGESATLTINR